jgi:glycosyltransferase involved in cell wall biosynthesis
VKRSVRHPGRTGVTPTVVFLHSSTELYGSDRMLLNVLDTLPPALTPEVWLPHDVPLAEHGLVAQLDARGISWRVEQLPVLRRRYLKSPLGLLRLIARSFTLFALLRRSGAPAVYLATSALLVAGPVARLAGCARVLVHVQEIWSGVEGQVLGLLGRSAHAAICISTAVSESVRGPLGRRSRVIVNAVEDPPLPPVPLPAGEARLRYVMASRWNAWKGHGTLLAAWNDGPPPGLLTILGGPPPAGESVDVPAMVGGLLAPESVQVRGEVASTTPAIDESDFLVVPSDSPEPFGLVAIEAFSRGRAVVGSDGGGLRDIVEDGVTGRLFPLGDARALRRVLDSLSREDARTMGRRAREEFERRYSLNRYREDFEAVWRPLLRESGQAERRYSV